MVHPADPGASLPKGAALEQYDGIAWTGCSLTIYEDDPRVGPQIELAKAAYESKVPSFGSCWAAQMAVVAAAASFGPIRAGARWESGARSPSRPRAAAIPLYFGKTSVFDGFISHVDEFTHLPAAACCSPPTPWPICRPSPSGPIRAASSGGCSITPNTISVD